MNNNLLRKCWHLIQVSFNCICQLALTWTPNKYVLSWAHTNLFFTPPPPKKRILFSSACKAHPCNQNKTHRQCYVTTYSTRGASSRACNVAVIWTNNSKMQTVKYLLKPGIGPINDLLTISTTVNDATLWSDPVHHGCNQSDKTVRSVSFWLVAAMVNWVTSQHNQCRSVQMKWGQLGWVM